ncbi:polysaccharide biosynthesis/export family protein [Lonepinella sp. MS14435]|uniref:polysaccharide biosynthesis/export family protein n=1 Tax=unclassified Lonepinella TaxID=2642006 RepID=UPI0036D95C25
MKKFPFIISLLAITLTACNSMPSAGPSASKIQDINQSDNSQLDNVDIVDVNDNIVLELFNRQHNQSFSHFSQVGRDYYSTIKAGDALDIILWEAPPAILFGSMLTTGSTGSAQTVALPQQVVSENGKITVPFLGGISVVGKTPEQIQNNIVARLKPLAHQPQAIVKLAQNNSSNVTILRQGNSIRMPLTPVGERVLDAVAAVGGASENAEDISVQLMRGNEVKTISLETLAANPNENIPLRSGDVLSLMNNPLSFTALGAVGSNRQVKFSAKGLYLSEAIGRMGGLIDSRSDPRGVFIFRYIPFDELTINDQTRWQARGYTSGMDVPTVYRVNLLEPKSLFWIQRFPVKNKDILYVSNAPLAEFQKFLRIIFSITSPVTSTAHSVNSF